MDKTQSKPYLLTGEEQIAQWNALAVELSDLYLQCWSGWRTTRTLDASLAAVNDARSWKVYLRDAIDGPDYLDHVDEYVPMLRQRVEWLREAVARHPHRKRPHKVLPQDSPLAGLLLPAMTQIGR